MNGFAPVCMQTNKFFKLGIIHFLFFNLFRFIILELFIKFFFIILEFAEKKVKTKSKCNILHYRH